MHLNPTIIIAIIAGLVLIGFCLQMLANDGNPDWDELAQKYPVGTPFSGSWSEGHCDLGAPNDDSDQGKLGMADGGIYIEPKNGKPVYIPFGQVQKAERIAMGDDRKPICYLHLDGDFKMSLPDEFVKKAGDKVSVLG